MQWHPAGLSSVLLSTPFATSSCFRVSMKARWSYPASQDSAWWCFSTLTLKVKCILYSSRSCFTCYLLFPAISTLLWWVSPPPSFFMLLMEHHSSQFLVPLPSETSADARHKSGDTAPVPFVQKLQNKMLPFNHDKWNPSLWRRASVLHLSLVHYCQNSLNGL